MPDTAPAADGAIHAIPLDAIDADSIARDRTASDPAAFDELVNSITLNGLRMPVELFGLATDDPEAPAYGLISGHRRLKAFRHLRDLRGNGDFATIPALLRLHAAWTTGYGEVIAVALTQTNRRDAPSQWEIIRPILAEAEAPQPVYTARDRAAGRPRRVGRPRPGLTLRRERTGDGWTIHLTGSDATSMYVDRIFEEIERLVGIRT